MEKDSADLSEPEAGENPHKSHHQAHWTFMTNHAHVLFCLAQEPDIRLREVALRVGITERAVQRIVSDLSESGYIQVSREGRRNHYTVQHERHLRHEVEKHLTVDQLLQLICPENKS